MNNVSFEDLALSPEMLRALTDMGFAQASPIQAQTIPLLMEGKDVAGQAQTGTGKTAAFGIPLIESIPLHHRGVAGIVMCPTRELANQVAVELKKLAKYRRDINILAVYGGESIYRQIQQIRRGVQIVVGTPGRLMDHLQRQTLSLKHIRMVVLDEADEMLNMGFRTSIEDILVQTPAERQTVLFSATMPKQILDIARNHQQDPVFVKVSPEQLTAAKIAQVYIETEAADRTSLISKILEEQAFGLTLVFCNTKRRVDSVVKNLRAEGHRAAAIHGDLRQNQRTAVLADFKKGAVTILVATDVAARGLHVNNIDGVFNYDIPLDPEFYVHRIGRTGRSGKSGKAYSFVTGRDELRLLRSIENFAKVKIERTESLIEGSAALTFAEPAGRGGAYPRSNRSSSYRPHSSRSSYRGRSSSSDESSSERSRGGVSSSERSYGGFGRSRNSDGERNYSGGSGGGRKRFDSSRRRSSETR